MGKKTRINTKGGGIIWTYDAGSDEPKSQPADPHSKSTLKKQYKRFWKQRIFNTAEADTLEMWTKFYDKQRGSALMVLEKIPVKLWLENKITSEQKTNIIAMLRSPQMLRMLPWL